MTQQHTHSGLLPADIPAREGQDETAQRHLAWQRRHAALYVESLRAGLARLEAFADGADDGDTFARAASDIAGSAMWMLAEARADHLVFHHGDQAWLDLADQIRTRAEAARAETAQG